MTKIDQIAEHLKTKHTISSWDAIQLYGATRLADIVLKLKARGWGIVTEMRQNKNTRFAVYHLVLHPEDK